jgi:hypothetical protein
VHVPDNGQALRRASAYLERIPGAVAGSGGHDQTWQAALKVVKGFDLQPSDAYALLANEYNPRCSPPWTENELRHKIADAGSSSLPAGFLLGEHPQAVTRTTPTVTTSPGSTKKQRFGFRPISELLAEEIPDTVWLIAPYLEAGSIASVVAPPNLGKTLLAFWFATQVAAAGRRVAIIEEEGGKRGFQKRIRRALAAVGQRGAENIVYVFKPKLSLMSPGDVLALCDELKNYDFIVIDSLARVTTGVEENNTKEMGQIVASLDLIREETGACVLTIHHTGKTKWKPGEVPRLEDGRGSSALAAGIDTALGLAPVADRQEGPG